MVHVIWTSRKSPEPLGGARRTKSHGPPPGPAGEFRRAFQDKPEKTGAFKSLFLKSCGPAMFYEQHLRRLPQDMWDEGQRRSLGERDCGRCQACPHMPCPC